MKKNKRCFYCKYIRIADDYMAKFYCRNEKSIKYGTSVLFDDVCDAYVYELDDSEE